MMFANQDFDVHAEIARPPENFDHAAWGGHAPARKTSQLHVDDGAIELRQTQSSSWRMGYKLRMQLLRQLVAGRDNNFLQQPRFVRRYRISARSVPEQAHD